MNFKNLKDLEKHLNNQMKDALLQVKEEVYSIIAEKLLQYYEEYTPVKYKRTYQLLKSLVKTEVIPTGHGFKANVYFDLNKIHYKNEKHSTAEIVKDALNGQHGHFGCNYMPKGKWTSIWGESMLILDLDDYGVIDLIVQALKNRGIEVRQNIK